MMSKKRQRSDFVSVASSSESKSKCRNERLIEGGRVGEVVATAFVSRPSAISRRLVESVTPKACQVTVVLSDRITGEEGPAWGSGGLLRGSKIMGTPQQETTPDGSAEAHPRKRVKFENFASYEVTPVTAKHNVASTDDEEYVRATFQFTNTDPIGVSMPDGGCTITNYIEARPATQGSRAIMIEDDDYSFGEKVSTPERTITKMPFLFSQVPNEFEIQVGHKVGMAVFRIYEFSHNDAEAPRSLNLHSIYGPPRQACIYTGEVTAISANGKTFTHDINTFEGCSGAVIFLLDVDQPEGFDETFEGMAVGIHSGGLDTANNIASKLPKLPTS